MAWDDRGGDFCYMNHTMVPYQHHRIKNIWHVKITENFQDSKIREFGTTNVVARTAREAAKIAVGQFQAHVKAMKEASQRERVKNKKTKTQESNERTENLSSKDSCGKPALDQQ